ncbi:hypothetical protein CIPAW_09G151900 [Carya illinoinensis]|uniref:Uncharacterized protein n=1 Tax=Carya illinoinensis TaxID=32201 RepID=A0A8T1PKP2_CARIL|nr:hypothetical protein CIPAW_09G151900 [Carya illinoinensis]
MICETGFLGSDCLVSVLDLGRTDVVLALGLQSLHHFGLYVLQGLVFVMLGFPVVAPYVRLHGSP